MAPLKREDWFHVVIEILGKRVYGDLHILRPFLWFLGAEQVSGDPIELKYLKDLSFKDYLERSLYNF